MKLLTISEASEILRVKMGTLYTWVHQKRIPYIKLNGKLCFQQSDIEAFILGNRHGAKEQNIT